jgi:hypothetical protein
MPGMVLSNDASGVQEGDRWNNFPNNLHVLLSDGRQYLRVEGVNLVDDHLLAGAVIYEGKV